MPFPPLLRQVVSFEQRRIADGDAAVFATLIVMRSSRARMPSSRALARAASSKTAAFSVSPDWRLASSMSAY
jgi:hypothetical protein